MGQKQISVIVPVYKTEEYLDRCVNSIRNQIYNEEVELEIILVDDGSPDNSPRMCDDYAKKDSRIKVVHKANGGLMSAWQAGVKESNGMYLCFVDSDDWIEEPMIGEMASLLGGNDSEMEREMICCNFVIDRPDRSSKHHHILPAGVYEGKELENEIKNNILGNENRTVSLSRCMKLFSRKLIEENIKYCDARITMGEDVNIVLPALLDCQRLVIMKNAEYYHYLYNEQSMVHKYDANMYEGIRRLYSVIKHIFEEKGRENGKAQSDKEYVYLLFLAVKNEIRGNKGFCSRIKRICKAEENREIIGNNPVLVQSMVNKLLYRIVKTPVSAVIYAVRMIFYIYDRVDEMAGKRS